MMKVKKMKIANARAFAVICLTAAIIISILAFSFSSAAGDAAANDADAGNAGASGQQQAGLLEQAEQAGEQLEEIVKEIPKTPEELRDMVLKKGWTRMINNSFFGPVHRTFIAVPLPFIILFGMPYDVSFVFVLVVIFSIVLFIFLQKIASMVPLFNNWIYSGLSALCLLIIIARTDILKNLAETIVIVVYGNVWWVKILVILGVIVGLMLFIGLSEFAKKFVEAIRKRTEEAEKEQKVEKIEAFMEGVRKAQQFSKKVLGMFKKPTSPNKD